MSVEAEAYVLNMPEACMGCSVAVDLITTVEAYREDAVDVGAAALGDPDLDHAGLLMGWLELRMATIKDAEAAASSAAYAIEHLAKVARTQHCPGHDEELAMCGLQKIVRTKQSTPEQP